MIIRIILLIIVFVLIFDVVVPMIFNGFGALANLVWWMFP